MLAVAIIGLQLEFVSGICVSLQFMMKSALLQCIVVAVTIIAYHAVALSMHANCFSIK